MAGQLKVRQLIEIQDLANRLRQFEVDDMDNGPDRRSGRPDPADLDTQDGILKYLASWGIHYDGDLSLWSRFKFPEYEEYERYREFLAWDYQQHVEEKQVATEHIDSDIRRVAPNTFLRDEITLDGQGVEQLAGQVIIYEPDGRNLLDHLDDLMRNESHKFAGKYVRMTLAVFVDENGAPVEKTEW